MNDSLMDLILSPDNMSAAWKQVKSNKGSPGVDNKSTEDFPNYMLMTGRSWGVSMRYRLKKLKEYVTGWMNYYGISQFYKGIHGLDEWLRRRIRMCYWKRWRHGRTKCRKLMELGVPKSFAIMMAGSSKSFWHLSKSYSTQCGMSNKWLKEQGLVNIKDLWCKVQGYKQLN